MKTTPAIVSILSLVLVVLTIAIRGPTPSEAMDQEQAHLLSKPLHEFGGKLLLALRQAGDAKSNVLFSPISIHQALSMLLVGTDQGSETRREILNSIGYSKLADQDVESHNQAYASLMSEFSKITAETLKMRQELELESNKSESDYRKPGVESPVLDMYTMMVTKNKGQVKQDYADKIKQYFNSSISTIDDKDPDTKTRLLSQMNDWGKKVGFDSPILSEGFLNEYFEALLIAAISVEAFWFDSFHESSRTFKNFGLDKEQVTAEFLLNSDLENSNYIEFAPLDKAKYKLLNKDMAKDETFVKLSALNFQAVKVGLQGDLSLTIFEPLSDQTVDQTKLEPNARLNKLSDDLFSSYQQSNETNLDKALQLLDGHMIEIDYLSMPKFKFESDVNLKSALYSIGLRRAFDESRAEISNVTNNKLFVKDVRHKAVIETTKKGIKAAGVTLIRAVPQMAVIKRERIIVDIENPFVFLLRYKSVPLFFGRLTNLPKTSSV